MHAIAHFVCSEGALDLLDDLFSPRNFTERQRAGRTLQAIEMFVKLEDPTVVESQPFPDCVTPLYRRVEGADPGLVAMHQLSVDVYHQIAISFVEFLKHLFNRASRESADCFSVRAFVSNAHQSEFNTIDMHTAARNIRGSAHGFHRNAAAPRSLSGDTAETSLSLSPRRTNALPRCRRSHAIPVARTASTR